jgi:hypothetical protein
VIEVLSVPFLLTFLFPAMFVGEFVVLISLDIRAYHGDVSEILGRLLQQHTHEKRRSGYSRMVM